MSSNKRKNEEHGFLLFLRMVGELLRLIVLILGLWVSCTHIAPDDTNAVIGMEAYSREEDRVSWYSQAINSDGLGDIIDSTKNSTTVIATNVPPATGIASSLDGSKIILYELDDGYWLGDESGPNQYLDWLDPSIIVFDIATNGDGTVIFGFCADDNVSFDCFHNDGEIYQLAEDQRRIGLTLDDTSNAAQKTWCAKSGEEKDEVIECEKIE